MIVGREMKHKLRFRCERLELIQRHDRNAVCGQVRSRHSVGKADELEICACVFQFDCVSDLPRSSIKCAKKSARNLF